MNPLNAARQRLRAIWAQSLVQSLHVASKTAYRKSCRHSIEQLLDVCSPRNGADCRTPIATRAQLVMSVGPIEESVTHESLLAYADGLVGDESPEELERLVIDTGSARLMRRFHRYMPGCNRRLLRQMIVMAEVMHS
jgi:hypothetical protein